MDADLKAVGTLDMTITGVNPKLLEDTIKGLKGVDGIEEFIRESMSADVKRYFTAGSPMEQLLVKGAYFRMQYLLNLLQKDGGKKETKPAKMGRYAR